MWSMSHDDIEALKGQYQKVSWREQSGFAPEELERRFFALSAELAKAGMPRPLIKAHCFAWIMENAQLAAEPCCLLQDHIRHGNLLQKQREIWNREVMEGVLQPEAREADEAFACGFFRAGSDYGHTAPDWNAIMEQGFPGILERLRFAQEEKRAAGTLTEEQEVFYQAAILVYESAIRYLGRLAEACRAAAETEQAREAERLRFCAGSLENLQVSAPKTLQEALQLGYLYHILQEEIEGERLRSFGGIDRLYRRFYEDDIASGRADASMEKVLLQHMMLKFHALTGDWLFGEPMYLGGVYPDGSSAVCELTYLVIDAFDELNIANPKFHARVAANSPREYVEKICDCIRRGNSSFVFLSDEAAAPMMQKTGATLEEARDYVPIGCYEPCILGKEVGCTGNGDVNLAKALELALHDGMDPVTGRQIGAHTGGLAALDTFDRLKDAVKRQIEFAVNRAVNVICHCEEHYMEVNPSPLFSATMEECVRRGMDAYRGGAKYNNSSISGIGQGTLADSLAQLKKRVYDTGEIRLERYVEILDGDWQGEELLRARVRRDGDKWGNDRQLPDALAVEFTRYFSDLVNRATNARGGRFKAGVISINNNYTYGRKMGATPDGRKAGEPVNKNLSASVTMDRSGLTAHMRSVCRIDHTDLPNGSVLELMLHPTAVAGEEGLRAFAGIVWTYLALGGFALHLNVFDGKVLRAAQADPEKYKNLQVRVCGWNQYFVNISRAEQDDFIRQAEEIGA